MPASVPASPFITCKEPAGSFFYIVVLNKVKDPVKSCIAISRLYWIFRHYVPQDDESTSLRVTFEGGFWMT